MAFRRSPKPVGDKLGIEPGSRVLVLGTPPAGSEGWPGDRVTGDADVVVIGCRTVTDAAALVPDGLAAGRPTGRMWLAYRLGDDALTRSMLGDAVEALGLELTWFRQVSLDDGWSAIWFKRRSEFRRLRH